VGLNVKYESHNVSVQQQYMQSLMPVFCSVGSKKLEKATQWRNL